MTDWWQILLSTGSLFGAIYFISGAEKRQSLLWLALGVFSVVAFVVGIQPR